ALFTRPFYVAFGAAGFGLDYTAHYLMAATGAVEMGPLTTYCSSVIFRDRLDAGQRLAAVLQRYRDHDRTVVLGIPRGGVVVAKAIAVDLHLPLGICPVRKLGAPGNPELAIGAVDDDAVLVFDRRLSQHLGLTEDDIGYA